MRQSGARFIYFIFIPHSLNCDTGSVLLRKALFLPTERSLSFTYTCIIQFLEIDTPSISMLMQYNKYYRKCYGKYS